MELLLEARGRVTPDTPEANLRHPFEVPAGVTRIAVRLGYHKPGLCQLYLSVFGPDGYRGTRMKPGAVGDLTLELDLGAGIESPGAIAGPVEPGLWRAQLDLERTEHTVDYQLTVEADREVRAPIAPPAPAANGHSRAGWYRGELHSHSLHSDGRSSVAEVVAAARRYGLDFLALTDHFTGAGWTELESLAGHDLAVLRGLELTGHRGHANMHGLTAWVDPFVDEPGGWTVNSAARAVREAGGLFCVNHPFSLDLGWRYHDFDWTLADALEVYHHQEGSNNPLQLGLWDALLRAGNRVTGVAGTDSHDPNAGRHRLGQVFTVVGASALEPAALLAGVRAGRAYVSLGPTLEFTAHSGPYRAGMGESLPLAGPVRLEARVGHLAFPTRAIVLRDGFYHAHRDLPASPDGPQSLAFEDRDPGPGYYRLEVYAREPQPTGDAGRDWRQTVLLSNPIFVGDEKASPAPGVR